MPIADRMIKMVEGMEMVKKMFEEGARLRAEHGPENVFDFSLGNPDVPPPPEFNQVLRELVNSDDLGHGYTPNPGHPQVRQAVAEYLSNEHGVGLTSDLILMTAGAAGALNSAIGALVNPGEEILVFPLRLETGYHQGCQIRTLIGRCTTDDKLIVKSVAFSASEMVLLEDISKYYAFKATLERYKKEKDGSSLGFSLPQKLEGLSKEEYDEAFAEEEENTVTHTANGVALDYFTLNWIADLDCDRCASPMVMSPPQDWFIKRNKTDITKMLCGGCYSKAIDEGRKKAEQFKNQGVTK